MSKSLVYKSASNSFFKNNFDLLRLLLAFLVFLAHWNILTSQGLTSSFFHVGGLAVEMFFVVSGFLIFWSYDADKNKKRFYIKRFFRIYPLYVLIILFQLSFFIFFSDGNYLEIFKYFIANMLFLNFLAPTVGSALTGTEVNAINGSLWTLKNEVVFYAIVPFIFYFFSKFKFYFIFLSYALCVAYMFVVDHLGFTKLLVQFPAQFRFFIVGIVLYLLFNKLNYKNVYFLTSMALLAFILLKDNLIFQYTLYPICIGIFVIFLAYFVKQIKISFDFSYSLYVFHFPVIQLFLFFDINNSNPIISFLSILSVVLLLSYFSEKYIEKKSVSIGRSIAKKIL